MLRNSVRRFRNLSDQVSDLTQSLTSLQAELTHLRAQADTALRALEELASSHETVRGLTAQADLVQQRVSRRLPARSPIRVLFLVHNAKTWDSYAQLFDLMTAADDFEPIVLTIPQNFSGRGAPRFESRTHAAMQARGVPHLRLTERRLSSAGEVLGAIDPDIVFRQSQWDADVPACFSTTALKHHRLGLVTYEPLTIFQNTPTGDPPFNSGVDHTFHRAAWRVYVANELMRSAASRDSIVGGRQFRALGHPKVDALRSAAPEWPIKDSSPRKHRVLWSAHHSVLSGWNDFGTFPAICDDMLDWARTSTELEFVFIYHPLLLETLERDESPVPAESFARWRERWDALSNATICDDEGYAGLLQGADVLVTDGPSMLTEGQIVGLPIVFLEREDHIPFDEIGDRIVTGVHRIRTVRDAVTAVRALTSEPDPLAERQRQNIETLFGAPGAANRILEDLRAGISAEQR